MNANRKRCQQQQKVIRSRCAEQNALTFFNLLTGSEIFGVIESLLPDHRERLFPPTETLSMFLAQVMNADGSCQNIVNQAATHRAVHGLTSCSTSTSGYCRARNRLPTDMVSALVRFTGDLLAGRAPEAWRWKGRAVRLVDGTTVTLPDTPANQAKYPQQRSQAEGLGFPICRVVGITCLSTGCLLEAAIGPYRGKGASEHSLLRQIMPTLKSDDILVGDGFYSSFFLIAQCLSRGIDIVFEQNGARKKATDFRTGKSLGSKDHIISLNKPTKPPDWMAQTDYDTYPDTIEIREFKAHHKIVVTTLLDAKIFSKDDLASLYRSRWHVELDLRNIKSVMGMETLSCKTPEMAEKEAWVYFLAYNLVRILMAEGAHHADVTPRQLSFKHTLQTWLSWRAIAGHTQDFESGFQKIIEILAEQRVGNRTGRVEPRAVKRRPKPYSLLMKTRREAREDILKHGHPPKQRPWTPQKTAA